jgi:hypothetical protein
MIITDSTLGQLTSHSHALDARWIGERFAPAGIVP